MSSQRPWIAVAVVSLVVAAGSAAWGWTSGPSVSTGSNPLKTFVAEVTDAAQPKQVFEVPPGQALVVTDVFSSLASAGQAFGPRARVACLLVDNIVQGCETVGAAVHIQSGVVYVQGNRTPFSLHAGVIAKAGSKVQLSGSCLGSADPTNPLKYQSCGTMTVTATGYLMRN